MATPKPQKRKTLRYFAEEEEKKKPRDVQWKKKQWDKKTPQGEQRNKKAQSGIMQEKGKPQEKGKAQEKGKRPGQSGQQKQQQNMDKTGKFLRKPRMNAKRRNKWDPQKKFISGKRDPFPGDSSVHKNRIEKYERARKSQLNRKPFVKSKSSLHQSEVKRQTVITQAAKHDLLLPEESGFLKGDEGEDTCTITQQDIAEVVDITSASKHFNLVLKQFGPYRTNYSRNGRYLLLGGQRGHIAAIDWYTKKLHCEINVMETINDVRWLHSHTMFAVAQKKWLYIYDNLGVELHCIKQFNDVLRMEFLPYHFLLATCSSTGFLQYLDVSVGKEISATCVRAGRLNVMCQNPHNAIIHLGHSNGTVSLWSPTVKEPLVKMICHNGAVRALSVDRTGMYMATSGTDKKMTIYDLRTYKPLSSCYLPLGAGTLCHSQTGLLAAGVGNIVQVYKDTHVTAPRSPYMCLSVTPPIHGLQFCPYEDVLGVGHGGGFTSMIVPGAGEANFDGLESNPYETKKQQREWEVKALLEKIQPELITLDPTQLVEIDTATVEQKRNESLEQMGIDPTKKTPFVPRNKTKGGNSTGNVLKRKKIVAEVEKREEIKKSIAGREEKMKSAEEKVTEGHRSALDRFKK
ncbi:WD repeat-containing protein 46 isoform X4 [Engystomops pustulosus]|uniref:WD repeat-containing protein 46 isoform X4 n=1 Tax=Engystomops pustulosus TaxID=76066 RepID=UPI003AFB4166